MLSILKISNLPSQPVLRSAKAQKIYSVTSVAAIECPRLFFFRVCCKIQCELLLLPLLSIALGFFFFRSTIVRFPNPLAFQVRRELTTNHILCSTLKRLAIIRCWVCIKLHMKLFDGFSRAWQVTFFQRVLTRDKIERGLRTWGLSEDWGHDDWAEKEDLELRTWVTWCLHQASEVVLFCGLKHL